MGWKTAGRGAVDGRKRGARRGRCWKKLAMSDDAAAARLHPCCNAPPSHRPGIRQGSRLNTAAEPPASALSLDLIRWDQAGARGSEAMSTPTHQESAMVRRLDPFVSTPGRKRARWPWLRPAAECPDPSWAGGTGPGEGLERGQKLSDQDRMTPWAWEGLGLMKWPGGAVDLGHRGDGC